MTRKLGDLNAKMGRAPAAELCRSIDREMELKLGEFNASDIQQLLSPYSALEHAPSWQVVALLSAREQTRVRPETAS